MGARGKPHCWGLFWAIAGLVGVTQPVVTSGSAALTDRELVAGLAGLWGYHAQTLCCVLMIPCDVFGVHGVCGIVGCIMTGIFAASLWAASAC